MYREYIYIYIYNLYFVRIYECAIDNSIFFYEDLNKDLNFIYFSDILQIVKMYPILWYPRSSEFPPTLQYLCNRKIHKNKEKLSESVKVLPSILKKNIDEFDRKNIEIKIKLEQLKKRIDSNNDFFASLMIYKKREFLCSIRLSKVYKELYTNFKNGKFTGVILPSPDEDIIKSLLYTADGSTLGFRMSIEKSQNLYMKYGIKAISLIIPQDAIGN